MYQRQGTVKMSSIFVTVKYDCQAAVNSPERVPGVLVLVNEEMSFKDVEDVARPLRWPNNIDKYGTFSHTYF